MKRRRRIIRSRVLLAALLLGLTALAVSGCHTVMGVGQDITAIGEAGQDFIDGGTS